MNKKLLIFGILGVFAIALATASLVTYLSNTSHVDMTIKSPMEVTTDAEFPLELYGGDSVVITSTTINYASVPIENVLIEVKVVDFDGEGITYTHSDTTWTGDIPVCIFGTDAYYYIGPTGGFTAPVDYNMVATSTITADVALEPREYNAEIKVITAVSRAC